MRGHLQPGKRQNQSEEQSAFAALKRGRRSKLATSAQTTLIKADQWARGDGTSAEIGEALKKGLEALQAKAAKAKK
jgi:hypothetical protein